MDQAGPDRHSRDGCADTVFTGGNVYLSGDGAVPASVAVRDGRIVAVSRRSDLDDLDDLDDIVGPTTEVVDVGDGLLVPGFQDAHVHPVIAGVAMGQCELHGLDDLPAYLAEVADFARRRPESAWINGGGWSMDQFAGGAPTKDVLDAVVPDRPVFLVNRDGHGAWVNSLALELAGVDKGTADPIDGRIERGPDGEPSGTLHEGAMTLVGRLLPATTHAESYLGLLAAQDYLFSLGVTGWQDAAVGAMPGTTDNFDVYVSAASEGKLKARVVGAQWWERSRGLEQVAELIHRRGIGSAGRFRPTSVKIMQDGVAENFTAAMLSPYLDACGHATSNSGLSFVDPAELAEYVTALDAAGFQVHFHALGDRAVREALDAIEAARATNGMNDLRHHLAHLQVVHPDDIPRFARLAVGANIQPLWATHEPQMDELTIPFLGPERAAWQYPFGDLARAGARLVAGSDWSVSSPNPLWGIHVAVNRTAPAGDVGVDGGSSDRKPAFLPDQALDLATALDAYTSGSAWVNHLDDVTGVIEPGRLADLVVLDRDLFAIAAEEIGTAVVRRTYVNGELVYNHED